jgi:hypothetical protein
VARCSGVTPLPSALEPASADSEHEQQHGDRTKAARTRQGKEGQRNEAEPEQQTDFVALRIEQRTNAQRREREPERLQRGNSAVLCRS